MKGHQKSCLSCIPDLVTFDINPENDDFLLISTDGLFQSLSITQIVTFVDKKD
jgi:serine/threonine protein phosphatase PrpC